MEILLGYITAIIAIGIIVCLGVNEVYREVRMDVEKEIDAEVDRRIANAHIETRVEIELIRDGC